MKKMEEEKDNKENQKEEELQEEEEAELYRKERDECIEHLKRSQADLINYKNQEKRRMQEVVAYTKEEFFLEILEILDNFNRAAAEAGKRKEEDELISGFLKIKGQLEGFLEKEGLKEIKAQGEEFDPYLHEAVETVHSESEETGKVIEEIQKGYLLGDKVLRPAKVKVVK